MKGMWKGQSPHAAPEISLPESKCSLLRRAHPNEGNAEAKSSAHSADNHLARHMLPHAVPAARTVSPHYPILLSR